MDPSTIEWEKLGIAATMGIMLVGFIRGWIVPGFVYERAIADRDRQTQLAERAIDALETIESQATRRR